MVYHGLSCFILIFHVLIMVYPGFHDFAAHGTCDTLGYTKCLDYMELQERYEAASTEMGLLLVAPMRAVVALEVCLHTG